MACKHEQICNAVAAALAAADLSRALSVSVELLPDRSRQDCSADPATVVVVPGPSTRGPNVSRDAVERGFQVDVGIVAPTEADQAEAKALWGLLEEIEDLLEDLAFAALPAAVWLESGTLPGAEAGYAPAPLREKNLFLGIVRLTYGWDP